MTNSEHWKLRLAVCMSAWLVVGGVSVQPRGGRAQKERVKAPASRVDEVVDTLHGVQVPDPYRWLEDQEAADTRAWIEAQNRYAEAVIGASPLRTRLEERLRGLMDRPEIGDPRRAGEFEYFTLRRRNQDLSIVYRRPAPAALPGVQARAAGQLSEPIDPNGHYEVVLDPHRLSPNHTTRVEIEALEKNGRRMVYAVRDGGQDEVEIRIRDLHSGQDLADRLPSALYSGFSFEEDGSGFYYTRRSRETGPRVVFHRFGEDPQSDVVVFGDGYGPDCFLTMMQGPKGSRLFTAQKGWTRTEVFFQSSKLGRIQPLVTGEQARFYPQFVDGCLWMRTDLDAPNNRLVRVDLAAPDRGRWQTVVAESGDVMDDFNVIGDRVFVTYLHNASSRIRVFTKDGIANGEIQIPPFHSAGIRRGGQGEVLLTLESFTEPRATWRLDLQTGARTAFQTPTIQRDTTKITVQQVWFVSKDGTRVPMFLIHRRDLPRDGKRAVLLHGYGGFYAPSKPSFNEVALTWVESGGMYAVANIRGGSEFGERWHRAGMLLNKQNVFDDFIAAAEWLVTERYTNPKRLAIWGVSNGGLLMGAALTQRPDLFRAVLCRFPDVDILRFYSFTTVNNMPALPEYGDARQREQFEAIRRYSPYQNVRKDTPYPAVMIVSGDLDTRVPPLSARKLAARLQAATTSGYPVILHYRSKAGHATGNGLPFSTRVADAAMELAFLMSEVGLSPPAHEQRVPGRR